MVALAWPMADELAVRAHGQRRPRAPLDYPAPFDAPSRVGRPRTRSGRCPVKHRVGPPPPGARENEDSGGSGLRVRESTCRSVRLMRAMPIRHRFCSGLPPKEAREVAGALVAVHLEAEAEPTEVARPGQRQLPAVEPLEPMGVEGDDLAAEQVNSPQSGRTLCPLTVPSRCRQPPQGVPLRSRQRQDPRPPPRGGPGSQFGLNTQLV